MDFTTLDIQQARIKQILFKSQLRSVLYGVREADENLFSLQSNALGLWLSTEVKPRYPGRPEVREAERLLQQLLDTGRELAAQYRQGQIDEARRGLTRIEQVGEELVAVLQRLSTQPPKLVA
ncbi:hypothetical protein D0N36_13660 [Hymenobacter lapidiphilus]|uniref:CZB domain-containing protein n=1 Tax=Hymenobacter sp. CCM 8763 TaxID=2303334 RepID=UPI000E34818B|nr:CZB domain-containing protein [Hymenobacter sp. CCM 8763]RFP64478.1 hypothetical protein D0N36_13660 [Hymenobacter sp. CCM 8763]